MQSEPVFLRINGHGAQPEFVGGTEDAYGDFAAIGGEKFADRSCLLHLRGDQCVARNSTLFHDDDATQLQSFRFTTSVILVGRKLRGAAALYMPNLWSAWQLRPGRLCKICRTRRDHSSFRFFQL